MLAVASPGLLIVLGILGVAGGGLDTPGTALLVMGLALLLAVGWELPRRTTIDADGVDHRSLVRRRRVPWESVVAFERGGRRGRGPLVVRVGSHTRLVLCDVAERPDQWDAIRTLISEHAEGVVVPPPPPGHPFARPDE